MFVHPESPADPRDRSPASRALPVAVPFCSIFIFAHGALGQTVGHENVLDPVVVTATRTAVSIESIVADVTLIDRAEIERAGPQSLAQLLQRQPGVEITSTGGPASTTSVFLRGANRGHTLVLIDGLRVGASTSGATSLEAIPLDQIDHIEILRGPASSLYGADAVGGVIQIFTRRATGPLAFNADVGYGAYDTRNASAGASGEVGAWRFALQGGAGASRGFNASTNPKAFGFNPDKDGYRENNGSAQLGWRWSEGQDVSVQAFRSRLNAQFDASPSFEDRTVTTVESYGLVSRNRLTSAWTSVISIGEGSDDSVSSTAFSSSPFRTRQRQYAWQHDLTLPLGTLSVAWERREERLSSDPGFDVSSRNTDSALAIYRLVAGAHALQANVRHDWISQPGDSSAAPGSDAAGDHDLSRTSGALAYGYRLTPDLRVSASAGTAFKLPTFNDLYFPGFSNPALQPETSRNVEGSLRYGREPVSLDVTVYRNKVRQLIVFECDASFNCAPQNVASATLEGVTVAMASHTGATDLKGSVDIQRPLDDATGALLPRRARRHAAVSATHTAGPWRFGGELVASSLRFDDAANTRRMGGYAVTNVNVEYALPPHWTLGARLDNVFDKHYELAADYRTAGASAFAGARFRF